MPELLLAASLAILAGDRAEWGKAMIGELDQLDRRSERWHFVMGCLGTTLLLLPRRGAAGWILVAAVRSSSVVCVCLVGYALLRYPGLVHGVATWLPLAAFLVVLASYMVAMSAVAHRSDQSAPSAAKIALSAAVVIGALWIALGASASVGASQYVGTSLLLAILLACLLVGIVGSRRGGTARAGYHTTIMAAIAAGILVFLTWFGETVLLAGRPYDAGMIRDFQASGGRDLATYSVNENLGSAMMLLLLTPLLVTLFGLAGARIAAARRPSGAGDNPATFR